MSSYMQFDTLGLVVCDSSVSPAFCEIVGGKLC
jgi:hypothetical protein